MKGIIFLRGLTLLVKSGAVGLIIIFLGVILTRSSGFQCYQAFSLLPQLPSGTSYIERQQISTEKIYVKGDKELSIAKLNEQLLQNDTINEEIIFLHKLVDFIIIRFKSVFGPVTVEKISNKKKQPSIHICMILKIDISI